MLEISPDDTTTVVFGITCTRMRRIAFESDLDIWIMREDGLKVENLADSPAKDRFCQWSPDGTKIAFISTRTSSSPEIWVMNTDGTSKVNLTPGVGDHYEPKWSPNGSQIAYIKHTNRNNDVWAINSDGTNPVKLTERMATDGYPKWQPEVQ